MVVKRQFFRAAAAATCLLIFITATAQDKTPTPSTTGKAKAVTVRGCFLRLRDFAKVPAESSGVLKTIHTTPGDFVTQGDVVAELNSREAELATRLAEYDHRIAARKAADSVLVESAELALRESSKAIEQATLNRDVSVELANSNVDIKLAQAAAKMAEEELERRLESRRQFAVSVSDLELSRKQHAVNTSQLDVAKAEHDQRVQLLKSKSQQAVLEQNQIGADRLKLDLTQARSSDAVSQLGAERAQSAYEQAVNFLEHRQIAAPLSGIVVEQLKQRGEWVEAGEPVARIVRLDVLLVEGFVPADQIDHSDRGAKVSVSGLTRRGRVTVPGKITFVSPEVDSVNHQVKVKAEIQNSELRLRPGQRVDMQIQLTP